MTKTILVKAVIEGSGIVNFDSNDQKWLWNRQKDVERCNHNNVNFGKGRYYSRSETRGDAEETYLVKVPVISADCIRHTMYEDNMHIHLPNIMHNDELLLNAVASPAFIERGYMFAAQGKTWKRKSAFAISYAKAVSYSVSALETYANTQPKTGDNKSEDTAETSFFKREVRGDTVYELEGAIDLRELGFISVSEVHDRLSFDRDYAEKFRTKLSERMGSEVPEVSYYTKTGDLYDIPEEGIQLTNEQVKKLAFDIVVRLARFNLSRTVTGFAKTVKLQVKFVDDPLTDLASDPEGWVTVLDDSGFNRNAFDTLSVEPGYVKVDLVETAMERLKGYKEKYGYAKKEKPKKEKKPAAKVDDSDDDDDGEDPDDGGDDGEGGDGGSSAPSGGTPSAPRAPKAPGGLSASSELMESILDILTAEGQTVGEIAKALDVDDSKPVSFALSVLIGQNKVQSEGERRGKRYYV